MQKSKKIRFFFTVILLSFIAFTVKTYASDFNSSDIITEYLSKGEEFTIVYDNIKIYPYIGANSDEAFNVKKGDIISIVQPISIDYINDYIEVLINDYDNGYILIEELLDFTVRKSDKLEYKVYKYFENMYTWVMNNLTKSQMGFIIILCILLIAFDKNIDQFINIFLPVKNKTTIIVKLLPWVILFETYIICRLVNKKEFYSILIRGLGIVPKGDTAMYYVLYIFTLLALIIGVVHVIHIFKGYNVFIAFIKLIEIIMIVFVISVLLLAVGYFAIIVILILFGFFAMFAVK